MTIIREAEIEEWEFIKTQADQIYFQNEKEFWEKEYYRISKDDCITLIKKKELFVLANQKEILGFVCIKNSLDDLSFSMLTVIEKYQKNGLGNLILKHIIEKAEADDFKTISLEILCPKNWEHPQKEFLIKWYEKMEFNYTRSFLFESLYPSHKKFMKCDLIFKAFTKITSSAI